jgi:hypothetical protein
VLTGAVLADRAVEREAASQILFRDTCQKMGTATPWATGKQIER